MAPLVASSMRVSPVSSSAWRVTVTALPVLTVTPAAGARIVTCGGGSLVTGNVTTGDRVRLPASSTAVPVSVTVLPVVTVMGTVTVNSAVATACAEVSVRFWVVLKAPVTPTPISFTPVASVATTVTRRLSPPATACTPSGSARWTVGPSLSRTVSVCVTGADRLPVRSRAWATSCTCEWGGAVTGMVSGIVRLTAVRGGVMT